MSTIPGLYRAVVDPKGTVSSAGNLNERKEINSSGKGPSEFQKVLSAEKLNFSQHAETRIRSRSIPWDSKLEARIKSGLQQAESKGSRETLILADNVAVIANVKSRTIITAMDKGQLKEKIFTNIDSAVLV